MNDWKIWFKFCLMFMFIGLCLGAGLIIVWNKSERRAEQYTDTIAKLEKRNIDISLGLDVARKDAARNLELLNQVRTSIRGITDQSRESLIRVGRIKDRAQRIDAIADLLVKTSEDLIKANNFMENVDTDTVGNSSR